MHVIMGATGRVGRAAATELLRAGRPVTALTRNADHASDLAWLGARIVEADIRDVDVLREAFRGGRRAFLLNPPADESGDTDAAERETVRCILAALDGSGLERVVAQSTYGARPGVGVGDLSVLHGLETGLRAQSVPAAVIRCAYLMSNWDAALGPAREKGDLPTMYPAEFRIPMVAPADVGRLAADLLVGEGETDGPTYAEGPERYSSAEVADAFARALDRDVAPVVTPRDSLEAAFRGMDFSELAAQSYARMTVAGLDEGFEEPRHPWRGEVTLDAHVRNLVTRTSSIA